MLEEQTNQTLKKMKEEMRARTNRWLNPQYFYVMNLWQFYASVFDMTISAESATC